MKVCDRATKWQRRTDKAANIIFSTWFRNKKTKSKNQLGKLVCVKITIAQSLQSILYNDGHNELLGDTLVWLVLNAFELHPDNVKVQSCPQKARF